MVSDAIYPFHKGGKEVRYHHLCPRLARQGFDVHVFTMQWWAGARHRRDDGVEYTAVTRCLPLYVGERRSILQAVLFSLGCFRMLGYHFDAIEADQMPNLPLFPLRVVATLKRVPLIVSWHEVWGEEYWCEYLGRWGVVGAALERMAMRLPDHIVAVNAETRARLIDGGVPAARVTVLPNGVDVEEIAAASPADTEFDVIYVGRLLEHKRVVDLVDAVGLLAGNGMALRCAIVGTGPERDALERRAVELNVEHQLSFLGSLDTHDAVFGLMKSSRVFVLPSVREGFGIVVVEAFACGIPVITTDHPDNKARLLVDDGVTGWLTKPDAESLAATIRTALSEPLDPDSTRDLLERCDWDRIAIDLGDIHTTMLAPA